MPIDFRYHAVSLIAVFLALVLGIFVGFTLVDPGRITQFVEEVKKDNERTREANLEELTQLRQQQSASLTLEKAVLPLLVENRLTGKRVILVLDYQAGHNSPVPQVKKLLETAGAEVSAVVTLSSRLERLKPEAVARLLSGRDAGLPPEVEPRAFLAERLGRRIGEGGSDFPRFLESEGLLRLAFSSDFNHRPDAVVLISGGEPRQDFLDLVEEPLVQGLKATAPRVIGCELSVTPETAIKLFQQMDLTTIDNLDTYPGQAALVLALAGAEGNFGIKSSADRVLPDLP
jgi:hypothetical protein